MPTILIVEDNDLNLKMARDLLQMAGFQTLEAEDATAGIQLAKERIPNLILMDMYLPIKDGYEAVRELKADPVTRTIPVIAFTALAMENERRKALDSGCCGFISKPIDVERFAGIISSYLGNERPESILSVESGKAPEMPLSPADEEIEEFFMIASHDLQAPLRKIDQFTGMIKRSTTSQISAEDFEFLERIERSTQQMHELVSDMLTLSRINRKGEPFRPVDLVTVMQEAIRDNQTLIDKLDAEVQIGELGSVEADPVQLPQLFQVLIENGLKFQPPNAKPLVRIDSHVNHGTCEITVRDNGIGFPQEHGEKIFRPFVRLHGASSKYTGRGMGLAIAQKIVLRHGGRIKAESQLGAGSTFIVTLPLQQSLCPTS